LAAIRKEDKYVDLGARYIFEPIAIETLGVFNASAGQLLADLGRRIAINTGEARETSFLFHNDNNNNNLTCKALVCAKRKTSVALAARTSC